ncbi:MAG: DNA-binding response regulator [Deltaproteobacteria bacterium HGW-Deltaproteobacteria-17]|nr:MAG: DNA-binding response regulator [Deltaproteobacteria bacterium HGW-Deltaproteobacteria-17]
MNAIIVDDEKLARLYLAELVAEFPEVRVVATCHDGFEAVKAITEHRPDLVFLDIQMPRLDGFEVLELVDRSALAVVFVTAFDQYALKAFDAHAVDYLLKPFSRDRLAAALAKVRRNFSGGLPGVDLMRRTLRPDEKYLGRIVVRDGAAVTIIPCGEVTSLCAEDDYVNIRSGGGSVLKHQTLASLEQSLDPERFVRIHRSAIINIEKLERIELLERDHYEAVLLDGQRLRISRAGHQRLRELLG